MTDSVTPSRDISRLLEIMARLRTPVTGCPWDLEQTFESIAPYTIEEAYEVADAISRGDLADLEEELGDLLLQVVYHSRMAEEDGAFAFGDVVHAVTSKMIRRHPHVFGSPEQRAAGAAPGFWARIKAEEKAEKADLRARLAAGHHALDASASSDGKAPSLLSDVPLALPALTRALKLQEKAAAVGFDWPDIRPVFEKLKEELAELAEVAFVLDPRGSNTPSEASWLAASDLPPASRPDASDCGSKSEAAIKEELGDVLFVIANIARHLRIDPEDALRLANDKFTRRFRHIEARLAESGRTPQESSLDEMDLYWNEIRAADKEKR